MNVRTFYLLAFILATILSYVSASIIGHGDASAYVVLGGISGFMSVVGLGASITIHDWWLKD